jgi:hypothetical protein
MFDKFFLLQLEYEFFQAHHLVYDHDLTPQFMSLHQLT